MPSALKKVPEAPDSVIRHSGQGWKGSKPNGRRAESERTPEHDDTAPQQTSNRLRVIPRQASQWASSSTTRVSYDPSQPPALLNLNDTLPPVEVTQPAEDPADSRVLPQVESDRPQDHSDSAAPLIHESRSSARMTSPLSVPPVPQEFGGADVPQQIPETFEDDHRQTSSDSEPPAVDADQHYLSPEVTTGDNGVINIPFRNADSVVSRRDLELRMNDGRITLMANQASLSDILSILAQDHGLNIVTSDAITEKVTVTLRDVPLADAMNAILTIQGLSWSRRNNIISITRVSETQAGGAIVQGRMIRVYPLSYITGTEVEALIRDLLSPVGKVKSMQSEKTDSRKSTDLVVVEDMPEYLERIDSCIQQLDRPPRQVQIEAHILQVELSGDNRHGVNLEAISNIAGTTLAMKSTGFAKATDSPAMFFGIDSSSIDGLIDALRNTVDARTLASPRVLVTHGQEAKIQIGGKLGYRQSTTTETSTIQGVQFLDVGVVLTVTPYIGTDGQILLKVNPEVSDGAINVETELPDERITSVDSTVLLNNGQGMVIGGLIREDDTDQRNKAAFLGEMWMVGRLFQHINQKRSRSEVIVVLIPRIIECNCPIDTDQQILLDRVQTPLFHGALEREYRPWEAELPDVRYRPGEFSQNFQEFRASEGTRWIPEQPRSGDFYLQENPSEVPVTMEAVPLPSTRNQSAPIRSTPPPPLPGENQVRQARPHAADRIPNQPEMRGNALQRASSQQAITPLDSPQEESGDYRQNTPVRENQTFHRTQQKSESAAGVKNQIHRSAAKTGGPTKGNTQPLTSNRKESTSSASRNILSRWTSGIR